MRRIIANKQTNVQNLVRSTFPALSGGVLRRALDRRDIRINAVRCSDAGARVEQGDEVDVYIDDKYLFYNLDIEYDDDHVVIINKPCGLESIGDMGAQGALERQIGAKVYPAHRLDATTSGLLLFAKDEETLLALESAVRERTVEKYYRCVVKGMPKHENGRLTHWLFKDAKRALAYVCAPNKPGAQRAELDYRVIEKRRDTSVLEIKLITGRTHQIRVQLSHIGCPLVGDDKYGDRDFNRAKGETKPMLCACRLSFANSGVPESLCGRTISIKTPF